MKIRWIVAILAALAPTVVPAVNPLSSSYITNERLSERYKSKYDYFASERHFIYYWQQPSFLDFNVMWGFCLTGDQCSGTYQLHGKIKDGVALSSGSTERIVDKRVTRSLSSDTAMLLMAAWSKAFKKITLDDRMGIDGTRYYTGINLFYGPPSGKPIRADGTFWSPDEFSIDYDLKSIASSIYQYLFWDEENENFIIEKCQVLLRTSQEERDALQTRFQNINESIARPIDPFDPPPPLNQEEKDHYIREYKAIWLQHYQKKERDFDRVSRYILPSTVRTSEPAEKINDEAAPRR